MGLTPHISSHRILSHLPSKAFCEAFGPDDQVQQQAMVLPAAFF